MGIGRRDLVMGVVLVALGAAVYAQVLDHDFVSWDDNAYVYENPPVRQGLTASGLNWAFTTSHSSNWHPLTWMSHMLDVELAGVEDGVWLHHATNVFFHLLNTVLLFALLRMATGSKPSDTSTGGSEVAHAKVDRKARRPKRKREKRPATADSANRPPVLLGANVAFWAAAWVSALFALHPLHVESVAWISERKDVLSTFFGLLTMLAYVRYTQRPFSWAVYLPVPVLLALGLMCKPMLVTWPVLLLLLDWWPLGRVGTAIEEIRRNGWLRARIILEKIPLVALVVLSSAITFIVQRQGGSVRTWAELSPGYRVANALLSYMAYIRQTLWPVDLAFFYPIDIHQKSMLALQVLGAVLLMAGITALAVWQRQRKPYLVVGWLWFVISLLPVIGLVQVGAQMRADRYMYIPQIGLLLMVAYSLAAFATTSGRRQAVGAVAVLSVLVSTAFTWRQVGTWENDDTLSSQALAVTDNNAVANYLQGLSLQEKGRTDEALRYLKEAVRLNPQDTTPVHDLAVLLFQQDQLDEAFRYFQQSVQLDPSFARGFAGLAAVEARRKNNQQALTYAKKAVELRPSDFTLQLNLGIVLEELQRWQEAAEQFAVAIDKGKSSGTANRDLAQGYAHLADMHIRLRDLQAAEDALRVAISLDPANADAVSQLGAIASEQGRAQEAVKLLRNALGINPQQIDALNTLAWLLATQRDPAIRNGDEAVRLIEPICKQVTSPPAAVLDTLAAAYAAAGRFSEATATAQQALRAAEKAGDQAMAQDIRRRLEQYGRGEALYES